MPTTLPQEIQAAGAVVFRKGRQVLLVHRPKYDDWAFPKGKLDRGEPAPVAAVREVEEETGLLVRLERPLASQHYPVRGRRKQVHYWVGRIRDGGSEDVSSYEPNDEIDQVAWVPAGEAERMLTYRRDRATLAEALTTRKRTRALVVLRHADARARSTWRGDDRLRPLLVAGRKQAVTVAGILAAYDVRRVVTSTSLRCVQSVTPYLEDSGVVAEEHSGLAEEDAEKGAVVELTRGLVDGLHEHGSTVLCTHRPVLPWVFDALGVRDPRLDKGEMLILHLRKGRVVGVERQLAH